MEYRKLTPGTKLRYVGTCDRFENGEVTPDDVLTLLEDDGTECPYKAHNERVDDWWWFEASEVELVETNTATTSPFRKVITLTGTGFEFTLDSEGNFTIRDVDDQDGIALPFETVVAAVDELRGHTK